MTAEAHIDPANAGEVFACAGIAVLASMDDSHAETGFVAPASGDLYRFVYPASALDRVTPDRLSLTADDTAIWLSGIRLDWFDAHESRCNAELRIWGGRQTAKNILRNIVAAAGEHTPNDWLSFRRTIPGGNSGHFNIDPDASWDSLRIGWSLNEHKYDFPIRPYVELLAFIGLQEFPVRGRKRQDGFRYSLWCPAPLSLARLALLGESRLRLGAWHAPSEDFGKKYRLQTATAIQGKS